jgi:hypothetical protein
MRDIGTAGYGLDVPGSDPAGGKKFFFLQNVETGSRAHPSSYSRGIGLFRGGKFTVA